MSNTNWLKPWRTIDLLQLCKAIAGEDNIHNHPVGKEWQYQINERAKGNDKGNLEWVGDNEKTPIINAFLLANGFEQDEKVMYWVCW